MSDVLLCVVRGIINVNKFEVRLYHPPTYFAVTPFRIMTAIFNILQSHFELNDCNFQHFAVTFRIMTAKC